MAVKMTAAELQNIALEALPADGSEITWGEWRARVQEANPSALEYLHALRNRGALKATVNFSDETGIASHTVRRVQEGE